MTTPSPEQIETVMQRIDENDVSETVIKTPASYLEGIRVGIAWATGQLEGNPLDD